MALTPKQEKFCIEYVRTGNKSEAYRIAYDAENMKMETINNNAYKLFENNEITTRIEELQKKVEAKSLYTIEQSIRRDLSLIQRYEAALDVLENDKATASDLTAAERTIKFIGAAGYSSAQDRLSKQQGWFEKDNKQKPGAINGEVTILTRNYQKSDED